MAGCDLNSDGTDDVIVGPGPGKASQMGVFDGATGNVFSPPLGSFLAFNQSLRGWAAGRGVSPQRRRHGRDHRNNIVTRITRG